MLTRDPDPRGAVLHGHGAEQIVGDLDLVAPFTLDLAILRGDADSITGGERADRERELTGVEADDLVGTGQAVNDLAIEVGATRGVDLSVRRRDRRGRVAGVHHDHHARGGGEGTCGEATGDERPARLLDLLVIDGGA